MQVNSSPPPDGQHPVKPSITYQVLNALYKYLLVKPVNVARKLVGLKPTHTRSLRLFFIKKLLGSGGEGHVYLGDFQGEEVARKTATNRYIPPEVRLANMQQEARVLCKLNHPNIIRVFSKDTKEPVLDISEETIDFEESYGEDFTLISAEKNHSGIRMEVADGKLKDFLSDLDDREKLNVCQQLMDATRYMLSKGVYNCDIKPDNILWLNGQPKLADFGSVCEFTPGKKAFLKPSKLLLRTPQYSPPEVESMAIKRPWLGTRGSVSPSKSATWSLATCFAEIMTGEQLFKPEEIFTGKMHFPKRPQEIDYPLLIDQFFKKHIGRFSPEMIVLLKAMLHPDPAKRLDLAKAQRLLEGAISRSF